MYVCMYVYICIYVYIHIYTYVYIGGKEPASLNYLGFMRIAHAQNMIIEYSIILTVSLNI